MTARVYAHPRCSVPGDPQVEMLAMFERHGYAHERMRIMSHLDELAVLIEHYEDGSEKIRRFDGLALMVNMPKVAA